MFLIFLLTLSLLILIDYSLKQRRYELTKNIPGPGPIIPFVGNWFFLTLTNSEKAAKALENLVKYYGTVVRLWAGHQLLIIACDVKDLEIILGNSEYSWKSSQYKLLKPWLGDSLFMDAGKKWAFKRKILMPAFSFKCLLGFLEIFDRQSTILVEKLKKFTNESAFDISSYIPATALDIIGESALGVKLNVQENENGEYVEAIKDVTEVIGERAACIFYQTDLLFKLFAPSLKKKQAKALKILHDFSDRLVVERRKYLAIKRSEDSTTIIDDELEIRKRPTTILDILLEAKDDEGRSLTNLEVRNELDSMIFAGHDTVEIVMNFAIYRISRNPDIQDRLFQEIREVFGDNKDASIDLSKLNQLQYMELVIKEALRLYSPGPTIGRHIVKDSEINGKIYPKGTDVCIPIFMLHRDPKIYPEPEEFRPERFLNDQINPFAFLPFSAGPKNCMGHKFAMFEMKCIISKILLHYELLPLGPEARIKMNVLIRPANGIYLGLRHRSYS